MLVLKIYKIGSAIKAKFFEIFSDISKIFPSEKKRNQKMSKNF